MTPGTRHTHDLIPNTSGTEHDVKQPTAPAGRHGGDDTTTLPTLGVIGNISRDNVTYPDGTNYQFIGGAALNIALAAAARGIVAAPIAVIGSDLGNLPDQLNGRGVRTASLTIVDQPSCQFHITYDRHGDVIGIESIFGAAELTSDHALAHLGSYSHLHICCRRPLRFAEIIESIDDRPYSIDVYSPTPETLAALTPDRCHNAAAIFTNAREYALVDQHADLSRCRQVIVTDGPRGARVLRFGVQIAQAPARPVRATELTGAGDTVAGAFLAMTLAGGSEQDALQLAMDDAASAVQRIGPGL